MGAEITLCCRRRAELSQTELGPRASLSRQAIGLIELGQRKPYGGMARKPPFKDRTRRREARHTAQAC